MKINQTIDKSNSTQVSKDAHLNHMSGISYDIKNPIVQLRVVASSSFFGEPSYYHDDVSENDTLRNKNTKKSNQHYSYLADTLGDSLHHPDYHSYGTVKLMETVIDEALNFDAEETLKEAVRLRNEDNIRTTPQVIMVRAANHPKVKGTNLISLYAPHILKRTDEYSIQLAYQIRVFGKPIPNSLKRAWKKGLEKTSAFSLSKYKMQNRKFKTVDVVNLVRAKSESIDLLMKNKLSLSEEDTWEALISQNGSNKENWEKSIPLMGHMALLRNLNNLSKNSIDTSLYLPKLIEGVKDGKQLPFRYYSAYNVLKNEKASPVVLDALETCLNDSLNNIPEFKGKVMSLCDNSGSAHGSMTSSFGTVKVSDIANLTAAITAKKSEEGYIGIFGDKLEVLPVKKSSSIFDVVDNINHKAKNIGQGTENGIWLFFDKAISSKEHWDHIFIYSDEQAGHGGLYGTNQKEYSSYLWNKSNYIDVAKLIKTYREKVNPNVHVYLVQVAGYKDTLVPEFYDKTYILGGWSDSVLKFAHKMSSVNHHIINSSSINDNTVDATSNLKNTEKKKSLRKGNI